MFWNQFWDLFTSDTDIYLSEDECRKVLSTPIDGGLYKNIWKWRIMKLSLEVVTETSNILNWNGYSFWYEKEKDSLKVFTVKDVIEEVLSDWNYGSRWNEWEGSKLSLHNIDILSDFIQEEKIEDFMRRKIMFLIEKIEWKDNREKFNNLLSSDLLTDAESTYLKELMWGE